MVSHGRKVNQFGLPRNEVFALIVHCGFLPLCNICYEIADKGLLCGFVERWHRDTNTCHLPFGEMSITLDDVSSFLHLPIVGQFPIFDEVNNNETRALLVELLGIEEGPANAELCECRANVVRLSWLRERYQVSCVEEQWEFAARAYLMHLVGYTIFADKSARYVKVCYLPLFRDLSVCGGYSWGAGALAHIYEKLGDASLAKTKQLGIFITLLQVNVKS